MTLGGRQAHDDPEWSFSTIKILLAHDNGLWRIGARVALEDDGGFHIVGEVCHGTDVVSTTGMLAPDAVLLDTAISGLFGLSCLMRLRTQHPQVKVVMCSASADTDLIEASFRHGACGYVLKTISPNDLGSAIRQALDGTAFHALGLPAIDYNTAARRAGLTDRETLVLEGVARGLANKEIAAELWLTVQTVKFHLTSIYRKLGITGRTEAARWAYSVGMMVHQGEPNS